MHWSDPGTVCSSMAHAVMRKKGVLGYFYSHLAARSRFAASMRMERSLGGLCCSLLSAPLVCFMSYQQTNKCEDTHRVKLGKALGKCAPSM